MKTAHILSIIYITLFLLSSCSNNRKNDEVSSVLDLQLDSLRIQYNIPAVTYGVVRNDSILVQNSIGFRDILSKEKVQKDDLFHLGSNTKSFTAFLAGKLVQEENILWDTKFFDLCPELKTESNQAYYDITLQQLLAHRARLVNFKNESEVYPIVDYEKNIDPNLSLPQKRYHFVKQVLKYEPIPLYDHHDDRYSNAGYIAATLMLEKAAGKEWEQMINDLSDELNLGVYIGWPDDSHPNQPKGHINPKDWLIDIEKALIPLPDVLKKYHYFNQYVLLCTPSGNLSIALDGFLKFLTLHIEGLNGKDNYLQASTYNQIFNSYPDYSFGWLNETYFVPSYHHRGSAGTFNSIAVIVPENQLGIVVMINTYDGQGIDAIVKLLINKFGRSNGNSAQ